jgi:hypothetical protein
MSDAATLNSDRLRNAFQRVEALAERERELVSDISNQIKAFERRLQALDGREPVAVSERCENETLLLGFRPQGASWRLVFSVKGPDASNTPGVALLTEAGVEDQIRALRLFPALLEQIIAEHERRLGELEPAAGMMEALGIADVGLYADAD